MREYTVGKSITPQALAGELEAAIEKNEVEKVALIIKKKPEVFLLITNPDVINESTKIETLKAIMLDHRSQPIKSNIEYVLQNCILNNSQLDSLFEKRIIPKDITFKGGNNFFHIIAIKRGIHYFPYFCEHFPKLLTTKNSARCDPLKLTIDLMKLKNLAHLVIPLILNTAPMTFLEEDSITEEDRKRAIDSHSLESIANLLKGEFVFHALDLNRYSFVGALLSAESAPYFMLDAITPKVSEEISYKSERFIRAKFIEAIKLYARKGNFEKLNQIKASFSAIKTSFYIYAELELIDTIISQVRKPLAATAEAAGAGMAVRSVTVKREETEAIKPKEAEGVTTTAEAAGAGMEVRSVTVKEEETEGVREINSGSATLVTTEQIFLSLQAGDGEESLEAKFDKLCLKQEQMAEYLKYAIEHGIDSHIKLIIGRLEQKFFRQALLNSLTEKSSLESIKAIFEYIHLFSKPNTKREEKIQFLKQIIEKAVACNHQDLIFYIITDPKIITLFDSATLFFKCAIEANLNQIDVKKSNEEEAILNLLAQHKEQGFDLATILDLNDNSLSEKTLLQSAIKNNYSKIVNFVINNFTEEDLPYQFNSLQLAANFHNIESMLLLLKKGVLPFNTLTKETLKWTPRNDADPFELLQLISYGIDLDSSKIKLRNFSEEKEDNLYQTIKSFSKKSPIKKDAIKEFEKSLHALALASRDYENKDQLLTKIISAILNPKANADLLRSIFFSDDLAKFLEEYSARFVAESAKSAADTEEILPVKTAVIPTQVIADTTVATSNKAGAGTGTSPKEVGEDKKGKIKNIIKKLEEYKTKTERYSIKELSIFDEIKSIFDSSVISGFATNSEFNSDLIRIINLVSKLGFNCEFLQSKYCFDKMKLFAEENLLETIQNIKADLSVEGNKHSFHDSTFIFLLNSAINLGFLDLASGNRDSILAELSADGFFGNFVKRVAVQALSRTNYDKKNIASIYNSALEASLFFRQNFPTIPMDESVKFLLSEEFFKAVKGATTDNMGESYFSIENTVESAFHSKIFKQLVEHLSGSKQTNPPSPFLVEIAGKFFRIVKEYPIASESGVPFRNVDIAILDDARNLVYVIECDGPSHSIELQELDGSSVFIPTCQSLRRNKAIRNQLSSSGGGFLVIDSKLPLLRIEDLTSIKASLEGDLSASAAEEFFDYMPSNSEGSTFLSDFQTEQEIQKDIKRARKIGIFDPQPIYIESLTEEEISLKRRVFFSETQKNPLIILYPKDDVLSKIYIKKTSLEAGSFKFSAYSNDHREALSSLPIEITRLLEAFAIEIINPINKTDFPKAGKKLEGDKDSPSKKGVPVGLATATQVSPSKTSLKK